MLAGPAGLVSSFITSPPCRGKDAKPFQIVYACTKILILLDQRDLIKETCRSTQWMVCSGSRKEKLLDSSPTSFQVLQLKTERRFSFFYLSRPAVPQARALKD